MPVGNASRRHVAFNINGLGIQGANNGINEQLFATRQT